MLKNLCIEASRENEPIATLHLWGQDWKLYGDFSVTAASDEYMQCDEPVTVELVIFDTENDDDTVLKYAFNRKPYHHFDLIYTEGIDLKTAHEWILVSISYHDPAFSKIFKAVNNYLKTEDTGKYYEEDFDVDTSSHTGPRIFWD